MRSYKEPSIPTHDVVVTYDDALTMGINDPASRGDYESCCKYIASHLEPKGWEFAIRDLESGRFMSYSVTLERRLIKVNTAQLYSLRQE